MPQFWTEDPTIGNALAGLADSFSGKSAVAMAATIEDIKKKRLQAQAAADATARFADVYNAQQPPTVAPQTPDAQPFVTSGGIPKTETVPSTGLVPLSTYSPQVTAQAQDQRTAEFDRVRRKEIADAALAYQHATSMGDVVQNAPKQDAFTQLAMGGVPKSYEDQVKMQTQLTGQLPMLDVKGTTNNWTATDPVSGKVTSGQTRDGRTDLNTGAALPPGALKMGDVSADQSPFKDQGAQLQALSGMLQKVTIGNQPLAEGDKQRANILLSTLYPGERKEVKDDAGNIRIITFNPKVVPAAFNPLIAQITGGTAPLPTGQIQQQAPPPPLPANPTLAAAAGQRATVPDALAATGQELLPGAGAKAAQDANKPIVPAGAAGAGGASDAPIVVQGSGDTQLKEILNHPTVKGAIDATRAYNEMVKASQADTPEAALHMVYMLAKIYDPNSVVREGEVATAENTSPAMEHWWALYNKQMNAQSSLSPRAQASFLEEGYKAAQAHYDAAKGLVDYAGERATRQGLDPRNVMPPLDAPQRVGQAPAQQQTSAAPRGPVEVKPADREAIAWARANPRDPRSAQILRQNGMQ